MLLTARPRKRLVAQLVTHVPKIVPIVETEPVRMKRAPELVLSSSGAPYLAGRADRIRTCGPLTPRTAVVVLPAKTARLATSVVAVVQRFIPVSAFAVPRLSPRVGEGRRR
jgi:hypothetical protein